MEAEFHNSVPPAHDIGRPYRSHLRPACIPCRKRKSRCQTNGSSEKCSMCQLQSTQCIFPNENLPLTPRSDPRKVIYRARRRRNQSLSHHSRSSDNDNLVKQSSVRNGEVATRELHNTSNRPGQFSSIDLMNKDKTFSTSMDILTDTNENSSHIVSPLIADDNTQLENYLSSYPNTANKRLVRNLTTSGQPRTTARPILFTTVQRRPLGVTTNQSVAAQRCETIEKLIEPHASKLIDLFLAKTNMCFPLFDEASFRKTYTEHKERISPALLANLYASAMVYWKTSPKLRRERTPDPRFIWVRANEALHSELFMSPGISTVIAIVLNVCGRPSTAIFANGGMVGTAVALSHALGLNRDPTSWDISPSEKSFRIRVWWLVVLHDRWCSFAYGTPLQIHRAQADVPIPDAQNLHESSHSPLHVAATSIFISLVTLTELLSRYLEHIYILPKDDIDSPKETIHGLESLLLKWEDSLGETARRIVMRGTDLSAPGAANFRLAYLAVKFLLKRIQLDSESVSTSDQELTRVSERRLQTQRAAEEIVHHIQELEESHLAGFWIPVQAFSLTSVTTFLLRNAARSESIERNPPLEIARNMHRALRLHQQNFAWDLADNCLTTCTDVLENLESIPASDALPLAPDFQDFADMDLSVLDEMFLDFGQNFGP